ncbi:hypothetical protein [Winogradskyella sp.]|uniref:hypothetical protein n=2 Tax=Winogradskyella sp. TaxID=1883156 RepID=UPI0035187767
MEKSFTLILIGLLSLVSTAQDSLCVFKIDGNALAKFDTSNKPIKKGDVLAEKNTVYLTSPSKVTLINSKGEAFKLTNAGTYHYNDILRNEYIENQKSLTSKYFKMIWKELTNKDAEKAIIGGVFRGDVLMEFPKDSAYVASNKLTLKWKTENDSTEYFIFIKNIKTDQILKLATNGSEISVYKDQRFFEDGDEFQWTVLTSEFPNLKNAVFFDFKLISKNDYKTYSEAYSDLIQDLEALGLTDLEIENTICQTYGLCK